MRDTSWSCDGDLAQEDKTFDVVDEIGHSDLGRCSGDPDSPGEQPHPILLLSEHMLSMLARGKATWVAARAVQTFGAGDCIPH